MLTKYFFHVRNTIKFADFKNYVHISKIDRSRKKNVDPPKTSCFGGGSNLLCPLFSGMSQDEGGYRCGGKRVGMNNCFYRSQVGAAVLRLDEDSDEEGAILLTSARSVICQIS